MNEPIRQVSLVLPLFNEERNLSPLYDEIVIAAQSMAVEIEIVFIDDGSTDASWSEVERLHRLDPRVRGVRFRRNFGKAAALAAGFAAARGDTVITLDADLQDDPSEFSRLLAKLDEGYDLVSGWKRVRNDPWHKVFPSRVFNWMVSRLTGVHLHDHNCGLKVYRRPVLDEIQLYGEFHRFTPVLAQSRGFRVGEIEVNHRPRTHGESKYGWTRFFNGLLDLMTVKFLTSFQHRPQHLLGLVGLLSLGAGVLGMAYLSVLWILTQVGVVDAGPIGGRPLLIFSATGVIVGLQIFSLGLIAELIAFRLEKRGQLFSVRDQIGDVGDSQCDLARQRWGDRARGGRGAEVKDTGDEQRG